MYNFYRMNTEGWLIKDKARELSFGDFVRYFQDSPVVIHNPYCYHFGGVDRDFAKYPPEAERLLATAKQNLAGFDFVGIMEEFDRSVSVLCQELGWNAPPIAPHENRSASEQRADKIDPEIMDLIRDRNQLDLELYGFARELFRRKESAASGKEPAVRLLDAEPNRIVALQRPLVVERRVTIQSVSAEWMPGRAGGKLAFDVYYKTRESIAELALGVVISDSSGQVVWLVGTPEGGLALHSETGQESCASFELECKLPAGTYTTTVAFYDPRRIGFHEHWIERAAQFTVAQPAVSESRGSYYVRLARFGSVAAPQEAGTGRCRDHSAIAKLLGLVKKNAGGLDGESSPAFRAQALLEMDMKLREPRVKLRLVTREAKAHSDKRVRILVEVMNLGNETLSSRYTFPVRLSYHWMGEDQTMLQHDGLRSNLSCDILAGDSSVHEVIVEQPTDTRSTVLCITLVQEGVCWLDAVHGDNKLLLSMRDLNPGFGAEEPAGVVQQR